MDRVSQGKVGQVICPPHVKAAISVDKNARDKLQFRYRHLVAMKAMETNLLQFRPPQSSPSTITVSKSFSSSTRVFQCPTFLSRRGRPFRLCCINSSGDDDEPQPVPPSISPPGTVDIRFRRGSRKRRRQLKEDGDGGRTAKVQASSVPKKWEEMSMSEKATELYMGEKGLLFWLNKFAYASIFIVIGGWIVFRFVGPALNLYQLDTPPLSPSSIFKGS